MRGLIEWSEGHPSRGRKIVMFPTVLMFIIITTVLFGAAIYGIGMAEMTTTLYITLVGLMAAIYGFYTGTTSDKSAKLADKAADIMMKKLDETAKAAENETTKD